MKTNMVSREEIEGMLPDYATGKLTTAEQALVDEHIELYPDLQRELQQLRSVFAKVEAMDFNAVIDRRTRNLSVKVHERLRSQTSTVPRRSWFRRLAPAAALAVLVHLFWQRERLMPQEPQSFDDELAGILVKGSTQELLNHQFADVDDLPPSFVPHEEGSSLVSGTNDVDQIDGLIAESIVCASTTDAESSIDEQTNETLDLLNTVDIQEAEMLISEVENGAG